MATTSLQTALDLLLGDADSLDRFVRARRLEGLSWRRIALDLYDATGVDVPAETLRAWYGGADESDEAVAP
jgi:hypothetical protein